MNLESTSPKTVESSSSAAGALTQDLAAFVASLRHTAIPDPVRDIVRIGFADCVGVMLAGTAEPPCDQMTAALGTQAGDASLLLSNETTHPAMAAWINATAAHALDYDDAALRGHPSAVLVPAIIAECQALRKSGRDAVAAYVAGYEVWAELAHRDEESHHRKGWHPTGIFGSIAAAAACAFLHRLDADRTRHALAIAASCSSGLMANFGSMTKPFHAGRAAHAGVVAARLAASGMTGAPDAIEHPQGFLSAVSPSGKVDKTSPLHRTGPWNILRYGLNLKKYPMCYCTHRPIDAMIDLAKEHALRADRIRQVTVSISGRNATVLRNHRPATGLAAKFSIEFAMASAVIAGRVGLSEVSDAFVSRTDVQMFLPRVGVQICPEEDRESGYAPFDFVVVELEDGRRVRSADVAEARGAFGAPLTTGERRAKFLDCAAAGGVRNGADEVFARLDRLDEERDLGFLHALRTGRPGG